MLREIDRSVPISSLPSLMQGIAASHREEHAALLEGTSEAQPLAKHEQLEIAVDDLVFSVVVAFRRHPHINNVLTHLSGASWSRVEQALNVILDPRTGSRDLSPLARNIVDLMCADRGVTGRILKPYCRDLLTTVLGERVAVHLITHVTCLFLEYEVATRRTPTANLTGGREAESRTDV